jgi:hypothetical protein
MKKVEFINTNCYFYIIFYYCSSIQSGFSKIQDFPIQQGRKRSARRLEQNKEGNGQGFS